MPGHATGSVAHRDAAKNRATYVHEAGRCCYAILGHGSIREEAVILFADGDDRVSEGQG